MLIRLTKNGDSIQIMKMYVVDVDYGCSLLKLMLIWICGCWLWRQISWFWLWTLIVFMSIICVDGDHMGSTLTIVTKMVIFCRWRWRLYECRTPSQALDIFFACLLTFFPKFNFSFQRTTIDVFQPLVFSTKCSLSYDHGPGIAGGRVYSVLEHEEEIAVAEVHTHLPT